MISLFTAVSLLLCVTSEAQKGPPTAPPPEAHVMVEKAIVTDTTCRLPEEITIVINDYDQMPHRARRRGNEWHTDKIASFDAARAHASIRYDGHRSPCVAAEPTRDQYDPETWNASFRFFTCNVAPTTSLEIRTSSEIPLSYVRTVWKEKSTEIDCNERGLFERGRGPIPFVRFPTERLTLQLGLSQPDLKVPGLIVNDLAVIRDPKNAHSPLTGDDIAEALQRQRNASAGRPAPYQRDVEYLNYRDLKLSLTTTK